MNYTYILKCSDNTLYTGWTKDLEKRLEAHNNKKGAKYTKSRLPVTLEYFEVYDRKEEAMKREYEIKKYTRKQKDDLIKSKRI
jgi:putative endonuclease